MRELWQHQTDALAALKQTIGQGIRRVVLSAPTGAGKTAISAEIVKGAQKKNNRLAFVVSNLSLIDQTMEMFYNEGIRDIGVIQANHHETDWAKPVQICSIQTINKRQAYPEAKIVIFDEVHVLHEAHKRWLRDPAWLNIPFIGLSATPGTKGLGIFFQTLLTVSTTRELIDQKILSPFKVYATGHPDLRDVKIVAGDYHEGQLSVAMQQGNLTADIVDTWKLRWGKDKTLCYGVDCAHAQAIQERFKAAGITCGYQDAHTPSDVRRQIKKMFHDGRYQIVANVGTLTTGTDWDVRCLILARPTRSEMLYQQIIGRALRIADGKDHAMILDHSDTTQRLGFVTDIYWDQLDDGKPKSKQKAKKQPPLPRECPKCTAIVSRLLKVCPNCGFELKIVSGVIERDGQLIEVTAGERKPNGARRVYTHLEKAKWYGAFKYIAVEKGYKEGWAANQYREKFGVWPRGLDSVGLEPPSMEVRSFVKSRMIAYAQRRKAEQARLADAAALAAAKREHVDRGADPAGG